MIPPRGFWNQGAADILFAYRLVREMKKLDPPASLVNCFTCRASRQGSTFGCTPRLANQLLHLPHKAAGVVIGNPFF
jgi:hypothetical protein